MVFASVQNPEAVPTGEQGCCAPWGICEHLGDAIMGESRMALHRAVNEQNGSRLPDGAEAKDAPTPASLARSLLPAQKAIGRTLNPSGKLDVSFSGCAVTSSELLMTGHYHEVFVHRLASASELGRLVSLVL